MQIFIPLLIGIGLIYYQYSSFSEEQIKRIKVYFKSADYFYVLLSVIISLFGYWSRSYRWKYSLQHLGYEPKFHNSFFAVSISYLINLTIPRSGEVTRAIILKKYEGIPFDKGFGTIVAERVIDFLIFLLFVITAFLLQFDKINHFIFSNISPNRIIFITIIGFISFFAFLLIWKWAKWPIILKIKSKFIGLIEGMTSVLKMKNKWKYLFHSFFIWFCYLLMFYVCIFSIPETASISFDVVIMGFIFGSLAVGFTNGGIGAFPISIAKVLLLYGIAEDAGTALGWIIWTSQTLLTIILGLFSYLFLNIFNKN
ncbi:flippase-like domain-containing protein [Flavobacterium sediminilitoris]|uniref:Flippase-like domain-containing protein n=1 Tax=Flavobacterium sediminilitoris TaxID=2024526 RepID=A0ABY4HQI6_9FLAO|nr:MULTISPECIES: lysylphosphatidylglycerol synthase transmembrane domain-containing protein [Flavobacterium]UOX35142.1 flippase-like domain-containing protein [Flavobacterium sediminilitoris]